MFDHRKSNQYFDTREKKLREEIGIIGIIYLFLFIYQRETYIGFIFFFFFSVQSTTMPLHKNYTPKCCQKFISQYFHAINSKNIPRGQSNIAIFSFINQIYRGKGVNPELERKKKKINK